MSDIKRQIVVVVSTTEGIRFYRLTDPTEEERQALKLSSTQDICEGFDKIYLALCEEKKDCEEAKLGIDESWWCRWAGNVLPEATWCTTNEPVDVFYIDMIGGRE